MSAGQLASESRSSAWVGYAKSAHSGNNVTVTRQWLLMCIINFTGSVSDRIAAILRGLETVRREREREREREGREREEREREREEGVSTVIDG